MKSASLPSLLVLLGASLGLPRQTNAQSTPYYRAGYVSMFNPSGPLLTRLDALSPPVLGSQTGLSIHAPQALVGVLGVAARAQSGFLLPFAMPVEVFLDPASIVTTFHLYLPNQQSVTFPLPQDPSLVGMNVAFQAFSACTPVDLSASNLQIAHLGISPVSGLMGFVANPFGPVPISSRNYMKTADGLADKMIFTNYTAAAVSVTMTITVVPVGAGPLEVRNGAGGVLGAVPANQSPMTIKVTVAAGTTILFYNNGGADMTGVTWTIDSVR